MTAACDEGGESCLYVHLHALVTDGCFETPAMPNEGNPVWKSCTASK